MAARALFAGPGALRALRRDRAGVVELVLARGAYLRLGDDWVLVAEPQAAFGPLSLAVAGLERDALRPGRPACVEPGRLLLGDRAVSLVRMRVRRPRVTTGAGRAPAGAATAALAVAGPPPETLVPGIVALQRNLIREAVGQLAGAGVGLTPAGDDVLAGFVAWRHATGAPALLSALAAGRSSPLGLCYLRCAERGELPDAGARVIAALHSGDRRALDAAARALRGWGASSGAALLWGIAAGAASAAGRVSAA